jgi:basic membrane protein A
MKKRISCKVLAFCLAVSILAGCATKKSEEKSPEEKVEKTQIYVVADTGGFQDQGFNQSVREHMVEFEKSHPNVKCSYMESTQAADYGPNLERAADSGADLVFAVGFSFGDSLPSIAAKYPNTSFCLIDSLLDEIPDNVICVTFLSHHGAFEVGYIAANMTKTENLGVIGGMDVPVIQSFLFGFKGGAIYGAKELKKTVNVSVQFTGDFNDASKGRAIASKMFNSGIDVILPAAGASGNGAIDAAKDLKKWVNGVDNDQSHLAPDNVLTSAIKNTGLAAVKIAEKFIAKEKIGGQHFRFGLKDGCVGIPEKHKNVPDEIYQKTMAIQEKIIKGEITPPFDEDTFNEYKKRLDSC